MSLTAVQRRRIVDNALWSVRNHQRFHYAEIRPIPGKLPGPNQTVTTDCSGFATLLYKEAGAPDPNGLNYDGQGYTGTLLVHMKQIRWWQRQPGDLIVYGPGNGHHVTVYLQPKGIGDALLASHGREGDPELVLQSVMKRGQPAPVRWLRLP